MRLQKLSPVLGALCATLALASRPCLAAAAPAKPLDQTKIDRVERAIAEVKGHTVAKPRRLLICARTEGFVHDSIPLGLYALKSLGEKTGAFSVEVDNELSAFTAENLSRFDGILFFNTTGMNLEGEGQREALLNFVRRDGKALIGIHSASDNFHKWPEGQALLGGVFHSHPWEWNAHVAVKVDEPTHPVVRAFEGKGFWVTDEIYQIMGPYSRETERTLLSLDMTKSQNARPAEKIVRTDGDFPISWVKMEGSGRVFYTSLGHNEHIYWDAKILQHYLDGIQFALGDLAADAKPVKMTTPALAGAAQLDSGADIFKGLLSADSGAENATLRSLEAALRHTSAENRAQLVAGIAAAAQSQGVPAETRPVFARVFGAFGSDAEVPLLAKWVSEGSDDAARALGMMATSASIDALSSLTTSGTAPVESVINALELSHAPEAAPALIKLLASDRPVVAAAARNALGRIGGADALSALEKHGAISNERDTEWSKLTAAWNSPTADLQARIASVRRVLNETSDATVRIAAATTLIELGGSEGLLSTANLLATPDNGPRLVTHWVQSASRRNDASALARLSNDWAKLPVLVQASVLSLAEREARPNLLPLVAAQLSNADKDLRVLAFAAFATCATSEADAARLVAAISDAETRPLAVAALSRTRTPGLEQTIRARVSDSKTPYELAAWLTIASNRVDSAVMPTVLKHLSNENVEVRQAAFRALKPLVRGEDLDLLLGLRSSLKTNAERKAWQDAAIAAISFRNDTAAVVKLLAEQLPTSSQSERAAFIIALTQMDLPDSLAVVRRELTDSNQDKRKEVIRALSSVRRYTAVPLLLDAAAAATDSSERILALRGTIDTLLGLIELGSSEKLLSYRRAWELAERREEKDAIIKLTDWLWDTEGRKWADATKAQYEASKSST